MRGIDPFFNRDLFNSTFLIGGFYDTVEAAADTLNFNLLPDTESIKKFERAGLKNLIREYNITSTRTSYYTRPEKHADYAFVSDGIEVKDFKILPDKISDHAPMSLEFA